jgi:hypothetical protein
VRARANLAASPSGGFVVVDGRQAQLVDLDRGRVLAVLEGPIGTVRPCFDRFPDGREVLFAAAPDYTSISVVEAESGASIAGYKGRASWDFCHVDFRLAAGGDRLITFGCVWGAPYEARIYDAAPWTRGALAATSHGPLPLVRQIEPIASNTLLPTDVGLDGALTSASLELRSDLGPDQDGDLPPNLERLEREEPAIAAKLAAPGEDPAVLIVRVLDPRSAATLHAGVWGVPRVNEQHIHHLDHHRIVVVGSQLLVADPIANRLTQHGEVSLASGDRTAVTRDGEVVVIARASEK